MNWKDAIKISMFRSSNWRKHEECSSVLVAESERVQVRGQCQRLDDDGLPRLNASGRRRFGQRKSNSESIEISGSSAWDVRSDGSPCGTACGPSRRFFRSIPTAPRWGSEFGSDD